MLYYYVVVNFETIKGRKGFSPFCVAAEHANDAWNSIFKFISEWNGFLGLKLSLVSNDAEGPFWDNEAASIAAYRRAIFKK